MVLKIELTHQNAYQKLLLYVCKLRYAKYPSFYFPAYLIAKFVQEFEFKFHIRQLNFQLQPIPNRYFDFLCRNHEIQSDHTIFINQKVFDYYIYQKDVNFLNLTVSDATKKAKKLNESAAEKVVKKILNSPENGNKNNKMIAIYQVFPLEGIPINKIFIKENSFWNFMDKYKLNSENPDVYVNLSMLPQTQKLPAISTKANIFLVNSPYDVRVLSLTM